MRDKDLLNTFSKIEPIMKGWSGDKKYCATKADGKKYLLRISPIELYEKRKTIFAILKHLTELGIPMCQPIEIGICEDGAYTLESWIEGEDAEETITRLPEIEQYILGLKSGEILRKIHTINAPDTQEEWATRFNRKTNNKIQKYHECGLSFAGDDKVIEYLENNRFYLKTVPNAFSTATIILVI